MGQLLDLIEGTLVAVDPDGDGKLAANHVRAKRPRAAVTLSVRLCDLLTFRLLRRTRRSHDPPNNRPARESPGDPLLSGRSQGRVLGDSPRQLSASLKRAKPSAAARAFQGSGRSAFKPALPESMAS